MSTVVSPHSGSPTCSRTTDGSLLGRHAFCSSPVSGRLICSTTGSPSWTLSQLHVAVLKTALKFVVVLVPATTESLVAQLPKVSTTSGGKLGCSGLGRWQSRYCSSDVS